MKQQNSRMVVEVNKLIANALLSDGGIYLPGIGSLSIITTTPEGEDPIRDIVLSEDKKFKSLIEVISERGNCTLQQAEQVFNRWRDVVTESERTSILGIGYIANGKFTMTSQMFNKLNPVQAAKAQKLAEQKPESPKVEECKTEEPKVVEEPKTIEEPTKIEEIKEEPKPAPKATPKVAPTPKAKPKAAKKEKKNGGYVWLLVAAIAICVGATIFIFTSDKKEVAPQPEQQPQVAIELPVKQKTESEPEVEMSVKVKTPTEKPIEKSVEKPAAKATPAPATPKINLNDAPEKILNSALAKGKSSPLKYKVVFGVFSSPNNGGKVIARMVKEHANSKDIDVRAYPYGKETYVLTLFESNSEAECQEFMRSNLGQSISKELWIYAKK